VQRQSFFNKNLIVINNFIGRYVPIYFELYGSNKYFHIRYTTYVVRAIYFYYYYLFMVFCSIFPLYYLRIRQPIVCLAIIILLLSVMFRFNLGHDRTKSSRWKTLAINTTCNINYWFRRPSANNTPVSTFYTQSHFGKVPTHEMRLSQ